MNSNTAQEYFYVVDLLDVEDGLGNPLPKFSDHALVFSAPPERAQGILFAHGYNLGSDEGLFANNGAKFVSEMFETTDGSNSTENDVPDRVRILVKEHPLLRVYPNMRFGRLHVQRYIVPNGSASGGARKQKRRSTRKRSQKKRGTRRH